jgi:hypothetical protein
MSTGARGTVGMDEARNVSHADIAVATKRTEPAAKPCEERSSHNDLFLEAAHSGKSAGLSNVGGRADALGSLLTVAVNLALAIGAWLLIYGAYLLFRLW